MPDQPEGGPAARAHRGHRRPVLRRGPLPLAGPERDALRAFGLAAAAMELPGALAEREAGNDSPETRYLISLGTAGLRD